MMMPLLDTRHWVVTIIGWGNMGSSLPYFVVALVLDPRFKVDLLPLWLLCPLLIEGFDPFVLRHIYWWAKCPLARMFNLPPVLFVSTRVDSILQGEPSYFAASSASPGVIPSGTLQLLCCFLSNMTLHLGYNIVLELLSLQHSRKSINPSLAWG